MKKVAGIVLGMLAMASANSAHAWSVHVDARIEEVIVGPDGSFYLQADRDLCNATNNPSADQRTAYLYPAPSHTPTGRQSLISVLLAARLSGRLVHLWLDDYNPNPPANEWACKISNISLK